MTISIITVCYNSEKTIQKTIESVLSQTYPEIEYIIIDGKSTDKTLQLLSRYKNRISKIISEKDNGIYDALNKGITIAKGEIVGILHSDDYFSNELVISKIAEIFNKKKTDALYSDLQYVSKDKPEKIIRNWVAGIFKKGIFKKGWMPPHPTFYVKRELFNKYGNYNTNFIFASDYELMLRFIHKHEIKLEYLPEVTVKMRVGGKGNVTFVNRIKANAEDKKAWLINQLSPPWLIRIKKPLFKLSQFWK